MAKKFGLNHPKVISKIAELVDDMMDDYSYTEQEYPENPIYKDWDEVGGEGYAPNTQSIVEEEGNEEGCPSCGQACCGCCGEDLNVVKVVQLDADDMVEMEEDFREDMQEGLEEGQEIIKDYMMSH